jgi:glycosyltransferase involved in cell wall biosynthesis
VKIAYIAASVLPSWTANSVQVMKVCQALTQNGHEVTLYVPGKTRSTWESLSAHYGVTSKFPINWIGFVPAFKKLDFVIASLCQAKKQQAELVYTRLLWAAVMGVVFRFPVILEIHDRPVGRMGSRLLRRFANMRGSKRIVLITQALRKILESEYELSFKPGEVIIAPDGVDLERYREKLEPEEARANLGLAGKFTAVYSGGFYEGRGLSTLKELAQRFPDVQFVWVGGRDIVVSIWKEDLAKEGIHNILLTGFVDNDILPLYQMAADILLMPYGKIIAGSSGGDIAEVSSPMKMFEYMASGRVILTSDIPVLREVLNENNAAFYIPEDIDNLVKKFAELMNNASMREEFSKRALLDVQQYSWQDRMSKIMHSMEKTR